MSQSPSNTNTFARFLGPGVTALLLGIVHTTALKEQWVIPQAPLLLLGGTLVASTLGGSVSGIAAAALSIAGIFFDASLAGTANPVLWCCAFVAVAVLAGRTRDQALRAHRFSSRAKADVERARAEHDQTRQLLDKALAEARELNLLTSESESDLLLVEYRKESRESGANVPAAEALVLRSSSRSFQKRHGQEKPTDKNLTTPHSDWMRVFSGRDIQQALPSLLERLGRGMEAEIRVRGRSPSERPAEGLWWLMRWKPVLDPSALVPQEHRGTRSLWSVSLTEVNALSQRTQLLESLQTLSQGLLERFEQGALSQAGLLTQELVGKLCGWCALDLLDDEGRALHRVQSLHTNAQVAARLRMTENLLGVELSAHTDHSDPEVSALRNEDGAGTALELLRENEVEHVANFPLLYRGRVLGRIQFGASRTHRSIPSEDFSVGRAIARTIALAMGNSRKVRELREAIEVRDQFLTITSDELLIPLEALQTQVDQLGAYVQKTTTEYIISRPVKTTAETGSRLLEQMSRQITRLGDLSRARDFRIVLGRKEIDFGQTLRTCVEALVPTAESIGSRVVVRGQPSVIGEWDPSRLHQLTHALVLNGLRLGAGRPVEVHLESSNAASQEPDGLENPVAIARLSVTDQGTPLDPTEAARLFGRLERALSARDYDGIGYGLFSIQMIARAHGGWVRTVPLSPTGNRFIVEIPLKPVSDSLGIPRSLARTRPVLDESRTGAIGAVSGLTQGSPA